MLHQRQLTFLPSLLAVLVLISMQVNMALGKRWARAYDMEFMWPIDNSLDENICEKNMDKIYHSQIVSPIPPDISGDWVSSQCEVRPGPEYILRKYRFQNRKFIVHQFYYSDSDCSNPLFSIVARGSYNVQWESWIIPGATEVDYHLSHVTVMPYSQHMADILGQRVNQTCPVFQSEPWQAYQRHEVLNYVELINNDLTARQEEGDYVVMDRDCTSALDFSLNELQLTRLEQSRHHRGLMKKLFLGDIHTDRKQRQLYRPTSYQEPLLAPETFGCAACRAVIHSDDYYPPTLSRQGNHHPNHLAGEWFSERCETRPNGIFVTRRLMFSNNNRTWDGYYHHFADELCRKPIFTIYARGTYVIGAASATVEHAHKYDFKVVQLKLKAEHEGIAETLNKGRKCGKQGAWKVGIEQDLSITKGCRPLGLRIPHVEYELMRIDKDHHKSRLYIGQRPSDGSSPTKPKDRPSSFQPALVKCDTAQVTSAYYGYQVAEQQVQQEQANNSSHLPTSIISLLWALSLLASSTIIL